MSLARCFVPVMLLAVLGTLAVMCLQPRGIPDVDDLASLPWTKHAGSSHADQVWSAATILPLISRQSCSPIFVYSCPAQFQARYVCPVSQGSDLWAGLIVGFRTLTGAPVVITAYAARSSFWLKAMQEDGCSLVVEVP